MRKCGIFPPGSSLKTSSVVVDGPVRRVVGDQRLSTVGALFVITGFEQGMERREQLPPARQVRLAGRPGANREHRSTGSSSERRPLDARGDVDKRARRSVV